MGVIKFVLMVMVATIYAQVTIPSTLNITAGALEISSSSVTSTPESLVSTSGTPVQGNEELGDECRRVYKDPEATAVYFPSNPCSFICVHKSWWTGIRQQHLQDGQTCGKNKKCFQGHCFASKDVEKCEGLASANGQNLTSMVQQAFGCEVICNGGEGVALGSFTVQDGAPCGFNGAWSCRKQWCLFNV